MNSRHGTSCKHCGVSIWIQPPKESGCNHVHYPEACEVCNDVAEKKRPNITIPKREYEQLLAIAKLQLVKNVE